MQPSERCFEVPDIALGAYCLYMATRLFFHFKLVHRSLGSFEDDARHMKCMHHDHSCYAYVGQQVKPCLGLYVMNTYHCV